MIYSSRHDCLVYQTSEAKRIVACLPEARAVNGSHVAVPFTLRNMLVAKQIGLPSISPIEKHYDWPHGPSIKGPTPQQIAMAGFATLNPRSFNLSEMRTGKTLGSLWPADYLMGLGVVKKALIIGTLSSLERVWRNEIFTHFLGRRTGVVLHGSRRERLDALSQPHDFYIVNHDGLGVGTTRDSRRGLQLGEFAAAIAQDPDFGLVIIDEASAYRNSATRRFKILKAVLRDKLYVWPLTGSPNPNGPTDAWALKKLINDNIESYMSFRDRTMWRLSQFKWLPRKDAATTVANFLQPSIRFSRKDCYTTLPVKIETRDVELSAEQKEALAAMKRDLQITLAKGAQITAVNEAALRTKLIQIICGSIYDAAHVAHHIDASPRLAALKELVEEAGSKCLVFAPLTAVVKLIYAELVKQGWAVAMVTGDTGPKARNAIFRDFQQTDKPQIIVADPGTVAHALDLTAANTVVWYAPTDKPEIYEQASVRIDGPAQKLDMLIVRLASTKIEREIYARLHEKRTLQGLVLDLVRGE